MNPKDKCGVGEERGGVPALGPPQSFSTQELGKARLNAEGERVSKRNRTRHFWVDSPLLRKRVDGIFPQNAGPIVSFLGLTHFSGSLS